MYFFSYSLLEVKFVLRRIYFKKILICVSALFVLFLIYLFPNDSVNKLEGIRKEVIYVDSSVVINDIFLLDSHNMVSLTSIMVGTDDLNSKAKELLESLIVGSSREDLIPNGFKPIIPIDTKILSLSIENGIVKVDFSKEFLDIEVSLEEKMISSIVYTLTSIDGIDGVIIFVDGDILNRLPKSGVTLPSTLDRNFGVNKEYNVTSSKNITSVTTYFVGKNNNSYYYIPVTKYMNDDREKIRIVIEELGSSNVYNTNLMSFLNSNVKLLSVEKSLDVLNLNFNEYLYSDFDTHDILEEVIYTICLSIHDNYDVKEVIFNVNNEEIYKSVLKSIE